MKYKTIKVLNELVARQIAAGEVIDRPASVLRELIDNSLDSDATNIEVRIKGAGLELIQVADNGIGIRKEDLPTSCLPHATSKISSSNDLQNIMSMGFRGEALPSIAAVSRLTIVSRGIDEEYAWQVEANHTHISDVKKASRTQGTTVQSSQIFQDIPARRNFLSSPQSELNHLKNIFLSKAAAFSDVVFSFQSESQEIILPKETPLQRSIRVCSTKLIDADFIEIPYLEETYGMHRLGLRASLGLPHVAQKNRKHIHIYINNRQIKEFSLLQAVEHAYRNVLHGQKYPQVVLFLNVPPHLLDVNIHPAKTEVKIRAIDSIRKLVISNIEKSLRDIATEANHISDDMQISLTDSVESKANTINKHNINRTKDTYTQPKTHAPIYPNKIPRTSAASTEYAKPYGGKHNSSEQNLQTTYHSNSSINIETLRNTTSHSEIHHTPDDSRWIYKTSVFETYLVFEHSKIADKRSTKNTLIFLDFHAAHERIVYDSLISEGNATPLLVPIPLSIDSDEESMLSMITQYKEINIILEKDGDRLLLTSIPSQSPIAADSIAELIEENLAIADVNAKIFSSRACRKAAKAGDHVDEKAAYKLLTQVLALESPRCPHGRPLWIEFDKYQLDKMIGRTE